MWVQVETVALDHSEEAWEGLPGNCGHCLPLQEDAQRGRVAVLLSDVTFPPTKKEGVLVVIFFSMLVWHSRMS